MLCTIKGIVLKTVKTQKGTQIVTINEDTGDGLPIEFSARERDIDLSGLERNVHYEITAELRRQQYEGRSFWAVEDISAKKI